MFDLRQANRLAGNIAAALRERGQTIAVADGATGGLVSAGLLTVPGALDFFVGGGVVYSLRARDVLFALPRDAYKGMRGVTAEYALLQARAIRDNFGADWGLAESGSVGGSAHPTGARPGRSVAALVGPDGFERTATMQTKSDERLANMGFFAQNALNLAEDALCA